MGCVWFDVADRGQWTGTGRTSADGCQDQDRPPQRGGTPSPRQGARDRIPRSRHSGWVRPLIVPTPSGCSRRRTAPASPAWCPSATGGCWSPFTFYRGAAKIMAADLASTPVAGLQVQLCGDAHLSNFGVFASPERRLLFDLNDFDETLPGPFEWDVKRMAANHHRRPQQRLHQDGHAPCGDPGVVRAYRGGDGRVRADGHAGHLVCPSVGGLVHAVRSAAAEASKPKKAAKAATGAESGSRRSRERRGPAIACKRCPSSAR